MLEPPPTRKEVECAARAATVSTKLDVLEPTFSVVPFDFFVVDFDESSLDDD